MRKFRLGKLCFVGRNQHGKGGLRPSRCIPPASGLNLEEAAHQVPLIGRSEALMSDIPTRLFFSCSGDVW